MLSYTYFWRIENCEIKNETESRSILFWIHSSHFYLFVSCLGLYLASFDAAVIVFESYARNNVFETFSSLQSHIKDHYIQTFKNQITTLLGSLDILGNPMGLLQDFSSGVEGLLRKGNVGGLFVNVAHGMSNSAAKVCLFDYCCCLYKISFFYYI